MLLQFSIAILIPQLLQAKETMMLSRQVLQKGSKKEKHSGTVDIHIIKSKFGVEFKKLCFTAAHQ